MLTEEQRKRAEELLLRERKDALELLQVFDDSAKDMFERAGEMSLYRFHPADVGTEMHEQEQEFMLASKEGRRLYAIDDALRRLYKEPETFGVCEGCGRDIEWERLEVLPETTLCAEHAIQKDADDDVDANPREAGPITETGPTAGPDRG